MIIYYILPIHSLRVTPPFCFHNNIDINILMGLGSLEYILDNRTGIRFI